tara:strand:+ start:114 stop:314 length:201 start_codon:yes stop_codon:yes gene_type:complete
MHQIINVEIISSAFPYKILVLKNFIIKPKKALTIKVIKKPLPEKVVKKLLNKKRIKELTLNKKNML